MVLTFSKELYPKNALLKAAYNFTDRAYIHLDASEDSYSVEIVPKSGQEEVDEGVFVNEMLCQSVRHSVYQQTKGLRELLAARALAACVVTKPDNCQEESLQFNGTPEEILKNWFETNDEAAS